jgi:uncharacterized protein YdhG (YjbR/CyaY superfamily)
MQTHLKAGIAIFNSGEFHAAHDAWEEQWLALEKDTLDERFLHGLIQYTAAIYHGTTRNWAGLRGLAESANEYLEPHSATYRAVSLAPIRAYLARLTSDPEHIEREYPPHISYNARPLSVNDLPLEEKFIVTAVLADEHESFDPEIVTRAIENAKEELDADRSSKYISLVSDFATSPDHRHVIYDRMATMITRQQQRDEDVAGLFDQ